MNVIYSLWDVAIGNAIAEFRSDIEMAILVRMLVAERGPAAADDLDLSIDDERDVQVGSLTGNDLMSWSEGVVARDSGNAGDPPLASTGVGTGKGPFGRLEVVRISDIGSDAVLILWRGLGVIYLGTGMTPEEEAAVLSEAHAAADEIGALVDSADDHPVMLSGFRGVHAMHKAGEWVAYYARDKTRWLKED